MAPCTYVRHTIGVALDSHTHFRSLEFTDIDGPAPVDVGELEASEMDATGGAVPRASPM